MWLGSGLRVGNCCDRDLFVFQPHELFVMVTPAREEEAWRVVSRQEGSLFIDSPLESSHAGCLLCSSTLFHTLEIQLYIQRTRVMWHLPSAKVLVK